MKKIEVKFPEIDGMRVNGATLDFDRGCSVVEYVEDVKFKRGDIVYRPVFNNHVEVVFVFNDLCPESSLISSFCLYRVGYNELDRNTKIHSNTGERLATDSKKQILFNALEKEGKYWDEEALEVKEFERVPDHIHMYRGKNDPSDKLWIGFGDDQLLGEYSGKYTVMGRTDRYNRVNCYLKPVTIDEIRVGDTIVTYDYNILDNYTKVCNNLIVYTPGASDVFTMTEFDDDIELFKLIPIR